MMACMCVCVQEFCFLFIKEIERERETIEINSNRCNNEFVIGSGLLNSINDFFSL